MTTLSARERVYLALLGQSNPDGRIEQFEKTETLDYARTPASEFERELETLINDGSIIELERAGRLARRFQFTNLARRREASQYVESRRDHVSILAARRRQLEPGRAPESIDSVQPVVVRAERAGEGRTKYALVVLVPGVGSMRGWFYYPAFGDKPAFVSPPSKKIGEEWVPYLAPERSFTESLLRAAQEHLRTVTGSTV